MKRILFVCMGNICRSPAAHCMFQQMVDEAGLSDQFEIDSAGTIGFHAGAPPDLRMQKAMRRRNIKVFGASRQLRQADLEYFDLVLVMDRDNRDDALRLATAAGQAARIRMFSDYCSQSERTDVPDPYYGGGGGFERVLDMIEDGCRGLLRELTNHA